MPAFILSFFFFCFFGFSSSELASDWLPLTMHESALQEGWRGSLCVCVRESDREEGRQHTIGAPNTRGSTQRSQQAPRNLAPETLFQLGPAWTGFGESGGQSRCHVRIRQAPLHLVRTRLRANKHTDFLRLPSVLHTPQQLVRFLLI